MLRLSCGLLGALLLVAQPADAQSPNSGPTSGPPSGATSGPPAAAAYREVIAPYAVEGASVQDLIASIKANGPAPVAGQTLAAAKPDAFTVARAEPQFSYHYKTLANAGTCRITSVDLTLTVTIRMPEWRNRAAAPETVQREWDRFHADVLAHERGHAAISKSTAGTLIPILLATPPAATCDQLKLDLRARAKAEIARHDRAQAEFDVREGSCRLRGTCMRESK